MDFYRQVKHALGSLSPQAVMPVDPDDAVHTLAVIDAAPVQRAERWFTSTRRALAERAPTTLAHGHRGILPTLASIACPGPVAVPGTHCSRWPP